MAEPASTARGIKSLWDDARSGIVGNLAWVLVLVIGGALLAVFHGTVPAVLLGGVVILAGIVLAFVIGSYEKRLVRVEMRAEGAITEAHAEAKRAETAASQKAGDAEASVIVLQQKLNDTRQQLAQATQGQVPLTRQAQGLVRRVRSLADDAERYAQGNHSSYASTAQQAALDSIVEGFQEVFGHTTTLSRIVVVIGRGASSMSLDTLHTVLAQLEAYAMAEGSAPP